MGKNTVVIYITPKRIGLKGGNAPLKCANPRCENLVTFGLNDFAVSKVSSGTRKLYCEDCAIELEILSKEEIEQQKRQFPVKRHVSIKKVI